ncbi:MAG TPA: molybdopterin-dependent oxidoreductase [Sporichthya sp.]|nr:molybdopterin-dependent oxidoreductase [Sporichthya sp.]
MTVRTGHRICPLCEATCGLEVTLDGPEVVSVRGADDDLFSQGFVCPKGVNLQALDADPDRLTVPLIRTPEGFVEANWEDAFAAVRAGLDRVRATYGRESLALYRGNPTAHNFAAVPYLRGLVGAMGTRQQYTASTADQMPAHVAACAVFGSPMSIAVPDIDRTSYLLMLGANPMVSNGSLFTAPDFPRRVRELKKRGGRLVVVDPKRTETARRADRHLAIRPGTDALFLLALLQELAATNRLNPGPHAARFDGVDEVLALAAPFTPERVAGATGLDPTEIRAVAAELADAPTAAVYGRIGTCTTRHGTLTQWLIVVLNALTGNLDRAGGAMFGRNPTRGAFLPEKPLRTGRWQSRVRGLPEALGEFPVATLADEILEPGPGQIRALITVAGNPVLSAPTGDRLGPALDDVDFLVCVDPYVNETTRYADVILPPPRVMQSGHFDWLLAGFSVRAVVRYTPPLLELTDSQLSEADILARLTAICAGDDSPEAVAAIGAKLVEGVLAKMVGLPGSPVHGRDPHELAAMVTGRNPLERHLDVLVRLGPFGDGFGADPDGITLQKLLDHPEGIDRGPMEPRLAEVIVHTDGRIQLCPAEYAAEVAVLAAELDDAWPEFVLIGRRALRSNNSWMHNLPDLVGGSNTCTLQLSVGDAHRLGIVAGDEVRVRSAVGEVRVPAEPIEGLRDGVVSLPHGWGHDLPDVALEVARKVGGVSANSLTDHRVVDRFSGNAVFNGVPVEVFAG